MMRFLSRTPVEGAVQMVFEIDRESGEQGRICNTLCKGESLPEMSVILAYMQNANKQNARRAAGPKLRQRPCQRAGRD